MRNFSKILFSLLTIPTILLMSCSDTITVSPTVSNYSTAIPSDSKTNAPKAIEKKIEFNGIIPVVHSQIGYLGGFENGKVKDIDSKITGNEKYKIYSKNAMVSEGTGSKLVREGSGFLTITPSKSSITFGKEEHIAIGGNHNALPRKYIEQNIDLELYKNEIKKILIGGKIEAEPTIQKILRVDLEGDGVDEAILISSNITEDIINSSRDKGLKKGLYSVVILRKVINGKVVTIPLKTTFVTSDVSSSSIHNDQKLWPYNYYINFILDANGDGKLEIFVNSSFPFGYGIDSYEINGDKATLVLSEQIKM